MKKLLMAAAIILCCNAYAQQAKIVALNDLINIIESPSEKIKVINFWATWCAPCVKELPLFEKLNGERADVKVTLVSMDLDLDPNPEKVYKFISRKNIKSEVILLKEPDPNSWINKIEKEWSGALPATIIINTQTGQRKFIEKELHDGDLEKLIDSL
jgi:thiol-disulfide isomerase/thioredoxin